MTEVKICGLSDAAGVSASLSSGARYVGFVFFDKSPRNVSLERARSLAALARGKAEIVSVVVNPDDGLLAAIASAVAPDWVQLHGEESPLRVAQTRRFARTGVIKALQIAGADDLSAVGQYAQAADVLMFDAKPPAGADRPGGHGAAFDWRILKDRRFARPWLLSGGLEPGNVARAIKESGARQVDVSSGVEREPGIKDPQRIAAFLAAAASPQ